MTEEQGTVLTSDRGSLVKQLLKQVRNADIPFENRAQAVHALRVEFPSLPEAEEADEAYQEALRAQGTESYRGYVSNLSPKSKGGQQVIERLAKAVNAVLKPDAPAGDKPPKAPKAPKVPKNQCLCGCGTLVHNNFAPGHDAKVKAILLKVSRGLLPFEAIPQLLLPHLKDFAQRWGLPTDADGNLIVVPPKAEAPAEG